VATTGAPWNLPYPVPTDLVRDGAEAIEDLAEATASSLTTLAATGFRLAGTRTYTATGTFAKANPLLTGDIKLRAIVVRCIGGGGSGGGATITGSAQGAAGAGGGSGGYSESLITNIAGLAATVDVTVGSRGSVTTGGAGGNGTASSFGTLVVANGGPGGALGTAQSLPYRTAPAAPAASGTGTIAQGGQPGSPGFGVGITDQMGGNGGGSVYGGGGVGSVGNAAGGNAVSRGAGGGGGTNNQNRTDTRAGGEGQAGLVVIDCYV
jgi:hypothetical protein